jgi:hypothetical protein
MEGWERSGAGSEEVKDSVGGTHDGVLMSALEGCAEELMMEQWGMLTLGGESRQMKCRTRRVACRSPSGLSRPQDLRGKGYTRPNQSAVHTFSQT